MAYIFLGSDHAGYDLKEKLQEYLKKQEHHAVDVGVFKAEPPADYPDIGREVAEKVTENKNSFGILVCGSGLGMCMVANKIKGIRAASCESKYTAEMARRHTNANILCLGGRILNLDSAKEIVDTFLNIEFEQHEERHVRRVNKIENP